MKGSTASTVKMSEPFSSQWKRETFGISLTYLNGDYAFGLTHSDLAHLAILSGLDSFLDVLAHVLSMEYKPLERKE